MILSLLIGLPIAASLVTALIPPERGVKKFSFIASLAVFLISLSLVTRFDPDDGGFQFREKYDLLPSFGIHYGLGIDGISLWLVLLTSLLTPLVLLGSFNTIQKNVRGFCSCVLLMEASVIGTLTATDLFLFYLFWELMLIPAFFLIGIWGGENRVKATTKFVLFTMLGSVLMLVGLLYVTHEAKSFDYDRIFEHWFPEDVQFWCFLAFGMAFLIKIPLVPFHAWLPDAYTEAPAGGTVLLSAVLVKLGAYGIIRFCIPLFPVAAKSFAPWLMVLAVAGIIHGALMASIQTDFKRMTAYASLSHMGLIVLGIFALTESSLQGSLYLMLAHGVYMAGLFLLIGMIYERGKSHEMSKYGGLAKTTPLLATGFLWIMLAALGMPGLGGFVGEILTLVSAYQNSHILALLALVGFILAGWYMFNLYEKLFFGPSHDLKSPPDLSLREGMTLLPLFLLTLWMGLFPNFFIRPIEKSVQMKVILKLKPPPTMTEFAAQQRRIQEEVDKEKRLNR